MSNALLLDAQADDAATINSWSDRNPATIVSRTETTIKVQEDRAINCTSDADRDSGRAFAQGHGTFVLFERCVDSPIETFTKRRNGRWVRKGQSMNERGGSLTIGTRSYYRDPSF